MPATLKRTFFKRDPLTCAADLIGCELVWDDCAGIVVETEAYSVNGDEACHTFIRKSAREFVASHDTGAAYVYLNYGMHWLLNVLVKGGREDGFVLLRAIEPTSGIELMQRRRFANPKSDASPGHGRRIENPKLRALCSGPGKLSAALGVRGEHHGIDLCANRERHFRLRKSGVEVISDVRIGISRAAHLPWRFLLKDSPFVSVPPKACSG
jgi:DNA-3-methyladenine glycosylase